MLALEVLQEEAKPLRHHVSMFQAFVYTCVEDIAIVEDFKHFGSVVQESGGSDHEDWHGPRCYEFARHQHITLLIPVQKDEDLDFRHLCSHS